MNSQQARLQDRREKIPSLHSRYNPLGEAERYINSISLNEKIRYFILIEPGLGYITIPLKKKFPGAKVIALHAGKIACETEHVKPEKTPDAEWFPENGISVRDFLEAEISDSEASEIQLLEWRPALPVFGEAYLSLVREAADFIKRSDANARTVMAFGERWFKNFFNNLDILKNVLYPLPRKTFPLSRPLLVTGAGPGLENTIPMIKETSGRNDIFILAVSSSQAALEAEGIAPDLVIATDGSQWARFHLYGIFRNNAGKNSFPLAVSLTATLPSQCESSPVLVIGDGSIWQTLILKEMKIPFIALPQRGTVSATALDLAFAMTNGEIFIAGMDLANSDIRSHARPYSFDWFLEEKANRLNPYYSQTYKRSFALKAGGSYSIYASWFKDQLRFYPRPIHPLGNNNTVFKIFKNCDSDTVNAAQTGSSLKENDRSFWANFNVIKPDYDIKPSLKALSVLEHAINDPVHSSAVINELATLLFPGKKPLAKNDLINAIYSLTGNNRGEKNG